MAIKNAKKMKNLSISYDYIEKCKPCLEKLLKDLHIIYQLYPIIATLENPSKYDPCNSMENTHLDAVSQRFYLENSTMGFMFGVWRIFFRTVKRATLG